MSTPYDAPSGPGDSGPDEAYRRWRLLQEQADAQHDALLVSDAERDQVCRRLSAAFSEGRITSPELDGPAVAHHAQVLHALVDGLGVAVSLGRLRPEEAGSLARAHVATLGLAAPR